MGRYANYGFEILHCENGNIKGINFGYENLPEHSRDYNGDELNETRLGKTFHRLLMESLVDKVFYDRQVKDPSFIRLLEGSDGRVLLTSCLTLSELTQYLNKGYISRYKSFSPKEIDDMINWIANHPDKNSNNMFDTTWDEYTFNIVSTDQESKDILLELYENITNKNVAISSTMPTLFKERGLSFVNMNNLTLKDVKKEYYKIYKKEKRR